MYEEIAGAVFNKRWQGKRLVGLRLAAFFIFFAVTVSVCSYFFVLKSELPELIKFALIKFNVKCVQSDSYMLNGNFLMLIVILIVILPITFAKNLDFLKYASASGMFSMTFCIITIVVFKFKIGCSDLVGDVVEDDLLKNECNYEPDHETLKDWTKFQNACNRGSNLTKNGKKTEKMVNNDFADYFLYYLFLIRLLVHCRLCKTSQTLATNPSAKLNSIDQASWTLLGTCFSRFYATIAFCPFSRNYAPVVNRVTKAKSS